MEDSIKLIDDGFRLEEGRFGDPVPIYWNRLCELAAIEAYLNGNWGALRMCEIGFFREAEEEGQRGRAGSTHE